jgi:hypothetical protein
MHAYQVMYTISDHKAKRAAATPAPPSTTPLAVASDIAAFVVGVTDADAVVELEPELVLVEVASLVEGPVWLRQPAPMPKRPDSNNHWL